MARAKPPEELSRDECILTFTFKTVNGRPAMSGVSFRGCTPDYKPHVFLLHLAHALKSLLRHHLWKILGYGEYDEKLATMITLDVKTTEEFMERISLEGVDMRERKAADLTACDVADGMCYPEVCLTFGPKVKDEEHE